MRKRGRRIAILATVLSGLTILGAGIALKDWAREEWWIWKLGSQDRAERMHACERLEEVGSARAIPHLLELWRNREERLPLYSETTLCKLGSRDSGALVRGLEDESPWVRFASVRTLLKICAPPEAIPSLALMVLDRESRERQKSAGLALLALGPTGRPHALDAMAKDPDLLGSILEAIPDRIGQDDPLVAARVLKELLSIDDPSILDEVLLRIVQICQRIWIEEIPELLKGPKAEKADSRAAIRNELIAMLHDVPASRPAKVREAFARTVSMLDHNAIEQDVRMMRLYGGEAPPPALDASAGRIPRPGEASFPGQQK